MPQRVGLGRPKLAMQMVCLTQHTTLKRKLRGDMKSVFFGRKQL